MSIEQILPFKKRLAASALPALHQQNAVVGEKVTLAFIEALSGALLRSDTCKAFPDLVALGFWLRRANIQKILNTLADGVYKPVGLVVHYTPANVDTMFVYSWVCALLMGNRNIVRLSSRQSDVQQVLLKVMEAVLSLPDYADVANTNQFVRFERDHQDGAVISKQADARVLWGGDDSVTAIRALACKPRCRDISFADRYSASYIDFHHIDDNDNTAGLLWRECEPFEQQACSSPRILFWRGDDAHWTSFVNALAKQAKAVTPSITRKNEQLIYNQWCQSDDLLYSNEQVGVLNLVHVKHEHSALIERHSGQYTLCCVRVDGVEALLNYDDARWQTLSYAGVSKDSLFKVFHNAPIKGIDRIVPLGNALTFSAQWDGYELLSQLARRVVFE
ncbi:acyl-CoA reductase [Alteromonas sp. 14N.309.X.WAT.G.H12]|uniref:acyl-CoA reductase n=1 Tax=Alteromonas sp. 14N.309.X.WAT.G.H12 TaxID=3120824 RepID=UPI002FD075BE